MADHIDAFTRVGELIAGRLRVDAAQTLAEADIRQARANLGVGGVAIYVERYKTGANTWQQAVQAALDAADTEAATLAGTVRVILPHAMTIEVTKAGDANLITNVGTFPQPYCLLIGSGTELDLNGSTLRLANDALASIIVNKKCDPSLAADTDISVRNGVFDVNCQNNRGAISGGGHLDGITFCNINGLQLFDLRFDNVRTSAHRLIGIRGFQIDNLVTTYSDGDAFRFGSYVPGATYDLRCFDGSVGYLRGENCMIGLNGSLQGNPVIASVKNCVFTTIHGVVGGGGHKFQDGCENVIIGKAIFNAATSKTANNSSLNSGLKIQGGASNAYPPKRIAIGSVISTDCEGEGLYLVNCEDVSVGKYFGVGNGTGGTSADVRLEGARIGIDDINSSGAGATGVLVRAASTDWRIDKAVVTNPGTAAGVQVEAQGAGTLNFAVVRDTRGGSAKMTFGLRAISTAAVVNVGRLETSGAVSSPCRIDNALTSVGTVLLDATAPLSGSVTLASGATSTGVTSANVQTLQAVTSKHLTPMLAITPANPSARALGAVTYTLGTGQFTLAHAEAAGTEVFVWRIAGWVPLNAAFA